MRPRGEIREAMRRAFEVLCAEHGPVTWRAAGLHAKVGMDKACEVTKDMVRANELVRSGSCKVAHCTRWVGLYEPAPPPSANQAYVLSANPFELSASISS